MAVRRYPTGTHDVLGYLDIFKAANAKKLNRLQQQLGNLLVEKKALNSKVVTSEFEDFRITMQKVAHGEGRIAEVSLAITRLEQYLKSEGLFKNVKTEFVRLKKEILDVLRADEGSRVKRPLLWMLTGQFALNGACGIVRYTMRRSPVVQNKKGPYHRRTSPIVAVLFGGTISPFHLKIHSGHPKAKRASPSVRLPTGKTFYVQAARAEAEAAGYGYDQFLLGPQEIKSLNGAVGRLYDHLDIHNRVDHGEPGPPSPMGKDEMGLMKLKQQAANEEGVTEVIDKVKFFEKMLQRQKARTHMEMWKLQDENRRLKASVVNLQRDNDRYRGVHPISSKAKDKQVERIEEKHRHQRRDMEGRIHELQEGLRVTLDRKVREKDDLEKQVKDDMTNLKTAIDHLHQQVFGGRPVDEKDDTNTGGHFGTDGSQHTIKQEVVCEAEELLRTLNNIKMGVNSLKNTKHELKKKADEFNSLENNLHALEREIDELFKHTVETEESSNQATKSIHRPADKLVETKKNFSVKMMQLSATQRMLKDKEGELEEMRGCLNEITGEVARLHDTVVALELHDIALSLDDLESGSGKKKYNSSSSKSTDDIPTGSEKSARDTVLKKLGFLTRVVEHFKKLSKQKEESSAKMQENINPLKVRINRLHGDLTRTQTQVPEDGTGNDKLFQRSESKSGKEIAEEVNMLLHKLSEVESVCRQLSLQSNRPKSEI
ncbi:hypothetical protein ScPMuIL_011531 [Solemya velum]